MFLESHFPVQYQSIRNVTNVSLYGVVAGIIVFAIMLDPKDMMRTCHVLTS